VGGPGQSPVCKERIPRAKARCYFGSCAEGESLRGRVSNPTHDDETVMNEALGVTRCRVREH